MEDLYSRRRLQERNQQAKYPLQNERPTSGILFYLLGSDLRLTKMNPRHCSLISISDVEHYYIYTHTYTTQIMYHISYAILSPGVGNPARTNDDVN